MLELPRVLKRKNLIHTSVIGFWGADVVRINGGRIRRWCFDWARRLTVIRDRDYGLKRDIN